VRDSLNLAMTPGNVATLEFAAAGAAGSQECVGLNCYVNNQIDDSRTSGRLG
jgi:hypothetical protein